MAHAIFRGKDGRRREVDFGKDPIRVEFYSSDETVEITLTADCDTRPAGKRRFVLLNLPRSAFSAALGEAARRAVVR
jgi:hypothetical protein